MFWRNWNLCLEIAHTLKSLLAMFHADEARAIAVDHRDNQSFRRFHPAPPTR